MGQWTSGGIVDRDLPAPQFCRHAPRQGSVGRDECGGSAFPFQGFTQGECDHQCFLCRIGGGDQCDAIKSLRDIAAAHIRQRAPGIGGGGRTQAFA